MSMWVAGAGLVAGIGGSLISSNAASKAQSAANAQAAANAAAEQARFEATNKQNEQFFRLSRGEVDPTTGYANALLPAYFKGGEAQLGQSAMDYFHQLQGLNSGGQISNQLQGNLNMMHPAIQQGLAALSNRYNGMDLQQRLANAQPVFGARTNAATQQRASINQSLLQTMGQLNAERGRGGFYGGSTFDRSRLLAATLGARGQASNLMSGAQLANAEDERALRDANLTGMQDLSPIAGGLQNAGIAYNMPATSMADYYQKAMSPFNFFRMGNQAYQNPQMPFNSPQIQPVLGGGAGLGSALGALGTTGLNYSLQNQLYGQLNNPGAGARTSYDQFLNQNPNSWAALGQS